MSRFRAAEDNSDTAIDISPLIDCVFILLIFFIVTTTFVEEIGLAADKPEAAPPMQIEDESETVVFIVTEKGDVVFKGNRVGLSGIQPIVREAMRAEQDAPVIIQTAEATPMSMLVRVMDEAQLAGATRITLGHAR